jgi:hypothetical protein
MVNKITILFMSLLVLPLFISCSSDPTLPNQNSSKYVQRAVVSVYIDQRLEYRTLDRFTSRLSDRFQGVCDISRDRFRVNRTNNKTSIGMEVQCYESGISRDDIKTAVQNVSTFPIAGISVN